MWVFTNQGLFGRVLLGNRKSLFEVRVITEARRTRLARPSIVILGDIDRDLRLLEGDIKILPRFEFGYEDRLRGMLLTAQSLEAGPKARKRSSASAKELPLHEGEFTEAIRHYIHVLKKITGELKDCIRILWTDNDYARVVWVFGRMSAEVSAKANSVSHLFQRDRNYSVVSQPIDLFNQPPVRGGFQVDATRLHCASAHFNRGIVSVDPSTP